MQHVLFYNFKQFFNSSSSGNRVFYLWPFLCFSYYLLQIKRKEKQIFIKVQEKQTNQANPKLISWFLWLQLAVRKHELCFHISHEFPTKEILGPIKKNADALIAEFPALDTCNKLSQTQWMLQGGICYTDYGAHLRISRHHAAQLEKAEPKYFLILWILLLATFLDCKAKGSHVYLHFGMFGETFHKSEGDVLIKSAKIFHQNSPCVCVHAYMQNSSKTQIKWFRLVKLVPVTEKLWKAKRENRGPEASNYCNTFSLSQKRKTGLNLWEMAFQAQAPETCQCKS